MRLQIPGAEKLQSFTFNSDSARPEAKGGVTMTLQANAGVKDYEVVGNEPVWESTVWKLSSAGADRASCKSGAAWSYVGSLPASGWKRAGQTLSYQIDGSMMKRAGLDQKGVYVVQMLAGQQGIVADHPAAAWMNEWSMSNSDLAQRLTSSSSATRVGVPGLAQLRSVLLAELRMPGHQTIKRTAGHIIIQSE
jgi:hypothetical protein